MNSKKVNADDYERSLEARHRMLALKKLFSESYHAATTFFVMTFLDRGFSFKVGLLLAICGFGRSNAFLNIGFVFYKCAKRISLEFYHYKKLEKEKKHETSSLIANIIGDALFPAFFCTLTALAPFVLFQWYGYTLYCSLTKMNLPYDQEVIDYAGNHSLKLPSAEPSDWCFYTIPMAYQYIQSQYWNVGFLKYFHWKQIPNFILAAPLIFFILERTIKFLKHHKEYSIRWVFQRTVWSEQKLNIYYFFSVVWVWISRPSKELPITIHMAYVSYPKNHLSTLLMQPSWPLLHFSVFTYKLPPECWLLPPQSFIGGWHCWQLQKTENLCINQIRNIRGWKSSKSSRPKKTWLPSGKI